MTTTAKTRKTKTPKRDDVHRPGAIDPSEYKYLFSFSLGTYGFNLELLRATFDGAPTFRVPEYHISDSGAIYISGYRTCQNTFGKLYYFSKDNEAGGCHICGARYSHGDVWLHIPTQQAIMIGHICADKMELVSDRGEWTRNQKLMARLKKEAAYQARKAELAALRRVDALKLMEANQGLEDALKTDHYISRDLAAKLDQYGSLSAKQIELAFKLANDVAEKAALEAAQQEVPEILPPAGRVKITGIVISTKCQDNEDFGTVSYKMLVEVEENGSRFKLWGTVPAAIMPLGPLSDLKGSRVSFTATVTPKEKGFGFYSRPTGAAVLPDIEMEARQDQFLRQEAETAMGWTL